MSRFEARLGVSVITTVPSSSIRAFSGLAAVFLRTSDDHEYPLLLCGKADDPKAVRRTEGLANVFSDMKGMFDGSIVPGFVAGRFVKWEEYSMAFICNEGSNPPTHGRILALMRNVNRDAMENATNICASHQAVAAMMGVL